LNLNTSNPLKRYPLAFFFILAYGIAWVPLALRLASGREILPIGAGAFSPAISAVILAFVNEGKNGTEALVSKLFLWRASFKWYLIALLAPIALELLAIQTHQLIGNATSSFHFADWIQMLPSQLPWLILILLFLVLLSTGEELGWRGYAMPRLQARYGSMGASLILGLLWGFWHLPLFWIPGSVQYGLPVPGYILATIGYTIIYTCIYNGSKGSVLLPSLYHAGSNLTLLYWDAIFPATISNLYFSLPALAILVLVVFILSGSSVFVGKQSLLNKDAA